MLMKVYALYDSKLGAYLRPFFMRSKGEALRWFSDITNDTKRSSGDVNNLSLHPEDFTLFELGDWCDETCAFSFYPSYVALGRAIEFKRDSSEVLK